MYDDAVQGIRSPQIILRIDHTALGHRSANPRGRPPLGAVTEERHRGHVESPSPPGVTERVHGPRRAVPEAKVFTHHHLTGTEALHELSRHEFLRSHGRHRCIEIQHIDSVRTGRQQQLLALLQGGQRLRCLAPGKDSHRVRIERDRDERQCASRGCPARMCKEGLMPSMHPVEDAYRENGAAVEIHALTLERP
jgi:hypothetical protein